MNEPSIRPSALHPAAAVCSACKHWNKQQGNENHGECRRYAPQTIGFIVNAETRFESRFPVTKAEDWCGEFEIF